MIVQLDGVDVHAATGGRDLGDSDDPVVLLIHGAGNDATAWYLQTRYLTHHGLRAVAIDLPAHGRSQGEPLTSIEQMADWVVRFCTATGLQPVHVVGHSMGTFVALELARRHADLVSSITLCGTATGMPVHPELLDAAEHDLPRAAALMAGWGHAATAQSRPNPTPGLSMIGGARALVENSRPGVLATDFRACMAYDNAVDAAAEVTCPATVIIGQSDKMTPAKGGRAIGVALPFATVIELSDTGHSMMTEHPTAVRQAIVDRATA